MTFTQTGQKRSAAGKEPAIDVDDSPNIQNMLRLITSEITAGQNRDDVNSQTKRDFELSFGLLTRASEVIDLLQDRCRQLEVDKKDIIEESRADMEAAHAAARQWQDLTASLKTKLDEATKQLNEMKARAENAEKRLDALNKRAEAADKRALLNEELAKNYHDKILASFGSTSRLQEALMQIGSKGLDFAPR